MTAEKKQQQNSIAIFIDTLEEPTTLIDTLKKQGKINDTEANNFTKAMENLKTAMTTFTQQHNSDPKKNKGALYCHY